MKNITLTLLFIPAFALSQSQKVYVDSRGRDCIGGLGLCSAGTTSRTNANMETTFTKISDNSIAMVLENNVISEADQKRIAGKVFSEIRAKDSAFFLQDSGFIVDENILKKLEVNPDLHIIKEGKYPVIIEENRYLVIFTLTKK